MPTIFPTDTSAVDSLEEGDKLLIADSSDSNNAKDIDASHIMKVTNEPGSTSEGYVVAVGDDSNHGQIGTGVHSVTLIGGGTQIDPNWIAVDGTHPTHGATNYDPSRSPDPDTTANHATVIGTYDQVNNQQASILASPHSYAPASAESGHNAAIGGSWLKVDGNYNFLGGGGGGSSEKNESTVDANKCAIIGGDSHLISGSHSAILAGKSNNVSHNYVTCAGYDAVSPFSHCEVYGMPRFVSQGDAMRVRAMFQDRNTSTSLSYLQVGYSTPGAANIVYRDIPFNEGLPIGIALVGRLTVMGVGVAGTNEGAMARYEQDIALYTTGTQGATSGWSNIWEDSSTSDNGPSMTRTDSGGNQLPMTTAPYLQAHSSGIFRIGYQQNTTDACHWLADLDVMMTVWAT